jgi:signal transduction histidine kinase
VYQEYSELAKKKNIQIGLTVKAVDPYIYADEFSVHQIFLHLLDNAVKFTMKGKIEITLGRDSRKRLYVDVVDTGLGISEEYQKLLFTPFTKEEMGYTKRFEGNGLGLALTKRYCELNNASIKVKSIKGKGTAFRVTFMENNIDNA